MEVKTPIKEPIRRVEYPPQMPSCTVAAVAESNKPKKRKLAHVGCTTIQVCVGKSTEHKPSIHNTLVSSRSRFFANTLNGNWKESEERTVNLPEGSADVFSLYMHFLSSGKMTTIEALQLYTLLEKIWPTFTHIGKRAGRKDTTESSTLQSSFGTSWSK